MVFTSYFFYLHTSQDKKGFQSGKGLKAFFHITLFLQYLAQLPHSLACSTLQMCKLLSANP